MSRDARGVVEQQRIVTSDLHVYVVVSGAMAAVDAKFFINAWLSSCDLWENLHETENDAQSSGVSSDAAVERNRRMQYIMSK